MANALTEIGFWQGGFMQLAYWILIGFVLFTLALPAIRYWRQKQYRSAQKTEGEHRLNLLELFIHKKRAEGYTNFKVEIGFSPITQTSEEDGDKLIEVLWKKEYQEVTKEVLQCENKIVVTAIIP